MPQYTKISFGGDGAGDVDGGEPMGSASNLMSKRMGEPSQVGTRSDTGPTPQPASNKSAIVLIAIHADYDLAVLPGVRRQVILSSGVSHLSGAVFRYHV